MTPAVDTRWMHQKTGGVYVVVGHCIIEKTLETGVLYRSAGVKGGAGLPFMRPVSEFMDGRFRDLGFRPHELASS